ncbi:MAG TPA: PP2C family protein-serine/threonine phosphatase [Acidimicrobiales bacterium]|jgi:serine phosphatase RsbU (regulator of sigma subunit)|nr:PP2C family protein-serine/threonine phosphatase [Acidimicrobiales bacterium]
MSEPGTSRGPWPSRVAVLVIVIGFVASTFAAWTAYVLDRNDDQRILRVDANQAGSVISGEIQSIVSPLSTALQVAVVSKGDAGRFSGYMSDFVGPGQTFVVAQLWQGNRQIAQLGPAASLAPSSNEHASVVQKALDASQVVVVGLVPGNLQRIGYAVGEQSDEVTEAGSGSGYVVYAERAIPPDRQSAIAFAFTSINYATYLGTVPDRQDLATADVAPSRLPLHGYRVMVHIPLGDNTLTLVATARGHLGGGLGVYLPWIFLAAGTLLTLLAASLVDILANQRQTAEHNAGIISALYNQLDARYDAQRTVAETLQRALLPRGDTTVPGLEISTRYVAGGRGVDVGGDWYGLIPLGDDRFAFIVGDVSGRGVEAAAVMGRLRFTLRAYLLEGHAPEVALRMCSAHLDIERDGHFATALVGVGHVASRRISVANAGHPNPLLIWPGGTEYLETDVGPPIGALSQPTYGSTSFDLPAGAQILLYTDGLIERRDEGIDTGMARLADQAAAPAPSLDERVANVLAALTDDELADDIAILAFGWPR